MASSTIKSESTSQGTGEIDIGHIGWIAKLCPDAIELDLF